MKRYNFCFYITIFLFALLRLVESSPSPPHKSDTQISEPSSSTTNEISEGIFKPRTLMRSSRIGNEGLAVSDDDKTNSEKDSWENENIPGESNYLSEDDDTNSEHNYFNYFSPLEKEDEQVKPKISSNFKSSIKSRVTDAITNNANEEALQMIQDIYNIDYYNPNYSGQNSQNEETPEDNELNTQQETDKQFDLKKFSNENYGFSYVKNNKSFEIKSTVELFKNDEWKIQKEKIPEYMQNNKHKEDKAWNHKMIHLAKEIDRKCSIGKDTQLCIRFHLFVFCITLNMFITMKKQKGDANIATHYKWFENSAKKIYEEKKYNYNIKLLAGEYFKYLNAHNQQESKNSGGLVEAHKNN
uniref:Uncharacterized protein n=1 Tax=Meloidogyne javanica TaxID=6303 RepID=A0A915NBC3_MELJA